MDSPHEINHLSLPIPDVLRAEKDSLHKSDKMFWCSKPEDVETPQISSKEENVRKNKPRK